MSRFLIGCFLATIAACAGETAPLQQQQQNDNPDASALDARGDEQQQNKPDAEQTPDANTRKVVAEGEVSGKKLDAQSAFYFAQKVTPDADAGAGDAEADAGAPPPMHAAIALVMISDRPDVCGDFKNAVIAKKGTVLSLSFMKFGMTAQELTPGTYEVGGVGAPGSALVGASFTSLDENCDDTMADEEGTATEGKVIVESIDGAKIKGRYDIKFAKGALKGSFEVDRCEGDLGARGQCK